MADVPDDAVSGRVVAVVQGDGQLGHTQAGTQVTRIVCCFIKDKLPEFTAQLRQLFFLQLFFGWMPCHHTTEPDWTDWNRFNFCHF